MYGNKNEKQMRLGKIVVLVTQSASGLTQAELARVLGVNRSTICKDLISLEDSGIRLAEDEAGRLIWPDWER